MANLPNSTVEEILREDRKKYPTSPVFSHTRASMASQLLVFVQSAYSAFKGGDVISAIVWLTFAKTVIEHILERLTSIVPNKVNELDYEEFLKDVHYTYTKRP